MMLDVGSRASLETSRISPSLGRFCVLVTSSDRARDIFEIVFQNADRIWRDCDWPRFVGFTSKHPDIYGFKAVATRGPSDWRQEVGEYLDALPDQVEYVLRIDEDALFMSTVDGSKLNAVANLMVRGNLAYVRLVPVTRNLAGRVIEYFRYKLDKRPLRLISTAEPYYSSVELAIWKRSYLRSLLRQPGTIWEFEHMVSNESHFAVWKPVVEQHQIVTRGKWNRSAPRLLARQGLSLAHSSREFQSFGSWLRNIREKISFQVAGFLSFRFRRQLNKISRH
jgi:hypothetical protein